MDHVQPEVYDVLLQMESCLKSTSIKKESPFAAKDQDIAA